MNFSSFDIGILVAMSIAVISMSFIFPAMGLTGENVAASDIPEYNQSKERLNLVDEFPRNPNTPSSGDLTRNESNVISAELSIWLHGDTSDGTQMTLFNDGNESDPQPEIVITNWENGNDTTDTIILQNENEKQEFNNFSYTIVFEWTETENINTSKLTYVVHWEIHEQPGDESWIQRVPGVRGIFSAGEQLAGIVGWIGSIIYWLVASFIMLVTNMSLNLLDIVTYLFDMMYWLIGTYFAIIDGAESWATVIVTIPGIILFLEFTKLTIISVDIIWIG